MLGKKLLIGIVVSLLGGTVIGYFVFTSNKVIYNLIGPIGMQQHVVQARDYGIKMAQERGDYHCCINPPCTMCYMEANQWNNHTAGTCACDDFIAKGETPCPQCAKAMSCGEHGTKEEGTASSCSIELE